MFGKKLLLALLGVLMLSSVSWAADVYPVKFQSMYAGPHVLNVKVFVPWAKSITEKSKGRMPVEFFSTDAIVKMADMPKALRSGTVDMGGIGLIYSPAEFPHSLPLNQAFLIDDALHGAKVANAMFKDIPEVNKELSNGLKTLCLWTADRTGIFSNNGPILSPADLKGKRVLFWSGANGDIIKQWGGIPIQVSPNDTYVALQRGMGEVLVAPLPAGVSSKIMEVAKDVTALPLTTSAMSVSMDLDYYNSLPKDLQQLLEDNTGYDLGILLGKTLKEATEEDVVTMRAAGCNVHELTPEQRAAFVEPIIESDIKYNTDVMKRYGINNGAEWQARIRKLADSLR